jgi:hypothetical protein
VVTLTIGELGSLGELLAAIATIATLVYLAIQIRANTRVTRAESRRAATTFTADIAALIGNSGEVASIFRRGLADPTSLDADESTRFAFIFSIIVSQFHSGFEDLEMGIIDKQVFDHTTRQQLRLLATPGGLDYWANYSTGYSESFIQHVDQRLASIN